VILPPHVILDDGISETCRRARWSEHATVAGIECPFDQTLFAGIDRIAQNLGL